MMRDCPSSSVVNHYSVQFVNFRQLFTLLVRREQYWSKMIELEESAAAPNRFKNRGGTLLREEKERNSLKKKIPELEDRLKELASNYEHRTGKPFLSWGETIFSLIEKSHQNYETVRNTEYFNLLSLIYNGTEVGTREKRF